MTQGSSPEESRHLLIVDDDPDFADSLEDFLLPFGYEIDTVYDLESALKAVLDTEAQVILLDVRVGHERGTDLIPIIRMERPDAVFVVMTAFADTDTAIEALQKGADDYLRKPLNLDVLTTTLERCFKNIQLRKDKELAQEALKASEIRFRNLIEGSLQGIMIHKDFKPVFANQALADLFGFKNPKEMLSLDSIERLIAQKDREAMQTAHRESLQPDGVSSYRREFTGLYQQISSISVECLAQAIEWEGERATQFTMVDISDRKALEKQIRQGQKMEAVGQLAGGIAHDINNRLQVISGFSEIALVKSDKNSQAIPSLEKVLKAAQDASSLIKQLLAFSRREVLRPQPLDLNVIVHDLMQMLRRLIGEHIDLNIIPSNSATVVEADKGMLEQVLVNICVNARDAMDRGGQLTIRTNTAEVDAKFIRQHGWAQPGRYACVEISDTGDGIPEEIIGKVFDPFFTTKGSRKGTGLGLSTVYGIIQQHNGMIEVKSEVGKGSTFTFYIPSLTGALPAPR